MEAAVEPLTETLAAVEGETLPLEEELAVLEALDELVVLVEGVTLGLFETQMHVYAFGAPHEAEQQSVARHCRARAHVGGGGEAGARGAM